MHRLHRDDQGSIPLVLLATIVIGGLVAVLFADVRMGQQTARHDRDFNQAIQIADAGLQSSFTFLSGLEYDEDAAGYVALPAIGDRIVCSGSDDDDGTSALTAPCSSQLNGGSYDWEARRVGREMWQVRSEGTFQGSQRNVEAMVGTRTLFPLAAFGDKLARLKGGNLANSYDGTEWNTGVGRVGSNHRIVLEGNATVDWVVRYGDATYDGGGKTEEGVETVTDEAFFPNVAEREYAEGGACYDRETHPYVASPTSPLTRGETYCFSDVRFPRGAGGVSSLYELADPDDGPTDEPVRIYIAPSGNLTIEGGGDNAARVNVTEDGVALDKPDAHDLQIFLASGEVSLSNHSKIAAGIYAPTSVCKGAESDPSTAQATIYGSIICRNLISEGGWNFHYDERLESVTDKDFDINGWREEGLSSTSFN
jgi:hypothetical protein